MARVELVHLSRALRVFAFAFGAGGAAVLAPRPLLAQQQTFHLDRLEMPGAPDDGAILFRPVTQEGPIVYTQLGLGLAVNPLRTREITNSPGALHASSHDVITGQFSTYISAGVEVLNRLTLGGTFPAAWIQGGNQPMYPGPVFGNVPFTVFSTTGPAVGDLRLDARYVAWRRDDGTQAVGVQLSGFVPTGSATNFGGDGSFGWMLMVTGEWTPPHFPLGLTFVANTGVHFRHDNSINDPAGHNGSPQGLGVGDEWPWAVGALMPMLNGRLRIAATLFGQTGLSNDDITGNTIFTSNNTMLEWNGEARLKLPLPGLERFFVGAGLGTRIFGGYGAADFRTMALAGSYWSIEDKPPHSPERVRQSIREAMRDTDGDGIPDDIDACPTVPEDHKPPDPMDGCPAPPEELDSDHDGIPDSRDACPREPGEPNPDPKRNGCPKFIHLEGSTVHVLQQVHFQTGSATILPDSFPMLTEIVQLLQANPNIKKMMIEGHTDSRGGADFNLDLSKRRAQSVRNWLVDHGVAPNRLQSEGYGLTRPIDTNDTDQGRAANRRVEFKVVEEGSGAVP
jgi:OmpA-OmpF porin, OOP family